MIKFENTEVLGWEHAIRGCRNPMNSWEKSDSGWDAKFYASEEDKGKYLDVMHDGEYTYYIGPNDQDLMRRLAAGGPVHAKYRRMITVYVDITAPLYWWKEFDTYKVGTVANSCSTMHKIADKEFTLDDFSFEHLLDGSDAHEDGPMYSQFMPLDVLSEVIVPILNKSRERYLETKEKRYWWQMIQLLPSSYNQKRTIMLNYEVLAHIYKDRKYHKLGEWREHGYSKDNLQYKNTLRKAGFCDWIKTLPYPELICGEHINKEETTPNCFVAMPGDK